MIFFTIQNLYLKRNTKTIKRFRTYLVLDENRQLAPSKIEVVTRILTIKE